MARNYQRWTERDANTLLYWWGEESRQATADRLGRSLASCGKKIEALTGSGSARTRDTALTFGALMEKTGYGRKPLYRAIKEAKVRPDRVGTTYRFTELQVAKIIAFLKNHHTRWAMNWDCCRDCGSDDKVGQGRHQGEGRCFTCYGVIWSRDNRNNGRGHGWRKGIKGAHPRPATSSEPDTSTASPSSQANGASAR